jgi:hypothetical protein
MGNEIERLTVKIRLLAEKLDIHSQRLAELERMVFGAPAQVDQNMAGIIESNEPKPRIHPVFAGMVEQFRAGA